MRGGNHSARAMSDSPGLAGARIPLPGPAIAAAVTLILIAIGIAIGGKVIAHQVVSGLLLGAIYMTVAVAFTLTIGVLNFLNFTIPTLFMLTGMAAWGLLSGGYLSLAGRGAWLAALACGVVVAVAASLLVERLTFRYLKMKHGDATEHAIPLVSSLGFLIIFENLVLISMGSDSQRFAVPFRADLHIAGIVVGVPQLVSCALAIAVVAALSFVLKRTKVGRALRTIAENPDTASLLGVDVDRTISMTFVIGAALAAVTGMMYLLYYGVVDFYMRFVAGIKAFTAAVLGGIGSLPGAMLGGLAIGLIETLWSAYFSSEYKDVAAFSILIVVLIFLPTGLLGRPEVEKV